MKVSKEFTFDSAHFLPKYYGKCERMHGHTYKLRVTVEGELGDNGLVMDFVVLKRIVKKQVLDKLNIQNRNRQNILFTPTWKKGHGTLLDTYEKFCTLIPREYNLLIRTHPYDLKNYAIVTDYIQNNHIENVYLINSNEIDIIENMAAADLIIGENSSVLYDWVFYKKPEVIYL